MNEKGRMVENAVAGARRNDHTKGLRERVIRAAAAKWPADICESAPGRGKFGAALTALLDIDERRLGELAAQLGVLATRAPGA